MRPKDFTPPKYSETHYCIFDKQSGEIVAMETQWNLARTKGGVQPTVRPALLQSLASQSGKAVRDLGVLAVKKLRPGGAATHVDLKSRKLIVKKTAAGPAGRRKPLSLDGP